MAKPLFVYLVAAARRIWSWSPAVQEFRKTPQICVVCNRKPKGKEKFQKDHINPVGKAPRDWQGWDEYYRKLFVSVKELQWLCRDHHKEKSNRERKEGKYK